MHRRSFLSSSAQTAAAALLMGRAGTSLLGGAPAYAQSGGGLGLVDRYGTPRASKLGHQWTVAHADLHNHTLLSDGDGAMPDAFSSMRSNNLDIACVTDHANGDGALIPEGCGSCAPLGMDEDKWQATLAAADAASDPDSGFIAMRGFEWSASIPQTGHMNVWFSETWTDPVQTAHAGSAGSSQFIGAGMAEEIGENSPVLGEQFGEAGHTLAREGSALERQNPANPLAMAGMYDWLLADPARPGLGGGADGLAGFNHPGREPGRFGQFAFDAAVVDRVVSLEVFNRRDDYIFEGLRYDQPSPISQALNAGWRVGFNGVTDEHGTDWGAPLDKGRCGLWLSSFDRDGIKAAMQARRFFATNRRGFRLDVEATDAASGRTALMGGGLVVDSSVLTFTIDVDGNDPTGVDDFRGRTINVQVCTQGDVMPTVVTTRPVVVPGADDAPLTLTVDVGDTPYVFLRFTDPERGEQGEASLPVAADYAGVGGAIAYASPFYLERT